MRSGVKVANSRGVTCVHDKDGWLGAAGLWQRLEQQGHLSLRVWQSVPHDMLRALRPLALRSGFGSPLLRIGYLKVFMDGTLGSQTAWMLDGSGVQITSGEELAKIIREGADAGWPVGVHAIGDRANREALDAFEQTRELWQSAGLRQRIEHAQCLAPEDITRFAQLGVAVSAQFSHAPSDRHLAERYWGDRLEGTYAFRSLLESGALVANGSDAPIEELDPWAGIVAGVERDWRPEQALTLDQALHATCVAPAWLSHDERTRGTLVPGRAADLVVLDRDPFASDLRDVQVVATMVAGRWVHNPPPWN
jgi:predicted amidohydrolase YtcJ